VIREVVGGGHVGIFHCCGADSVTRRELAEATVDAFALDRSLLHFGPAPKEAFAGQRIPHDTSVSAVATAARLGTPLPDLAQLLAAFRRERTHGQVGLLD
jgi:dTDP-4-dehydrorhamnose reductase